LTFLNHQLFPNILDKAGFDSKISHFFSDFLSNRQTQYVWNHFVSSYFEANIDVGQDSALSPILPALYIAPILHIFKNLTLSFIDNRLLISQEKSYEKCKYLL